MILLFIAVWGCWRCQKKDKIDPWRLAMLDLLKRVKLIISGIFFS
jgi:Zn ribbon nucleic-acid-binding protein